METLELKNPFLFIKKPKDNLLKDYGYYSFEDRTFDLSELFIKNINKEMTNLINANVYEGVAKHYQSYGVMKNHIIYNGTYKLAPLKEYVGNIPIGNQIEIKEKYELLCKNPFLNKSFELLILAPLNNFAEESSIKAIDPIVFAYFKEGEHCAEKNYLITLSQWI